MTCHALVRPRIAWPSWICVISAPLLLLAVVSAAAHVRLGLGHWPKPMWEDYTTPAFKLHMFACLWLGMFSTFVAPAIWLVLLCFRPLRGNLPFHGRQLGVFFGAWAIFWLLVWCDPFRLVTWWLD
jgi:hypothetical protein